MVSQISIDNLKTGGDGRPPIGAIFGKPGVGKTTLACRWPSPIVIQTEDGMTSPAFANIPTFGVLQSLEAVKDVMSLVLEHAPAKGWKTVVLDTASKLDNLVIEYVCRTNSWKSITEPAYGKGYEPYVAEWRSLMQGFMYIRNVCGLNVLLLDHVRVARINPPDAESYTKYVPAISDRVAPIIIPDLDFLLFATYPITTISDKKDEKFGQKFNRALQDKARLYCQERGGHEAKNRYDMPEWLPLDFGVIAKHVPTIAGLQPANPQLAVAG